MTEPTREELNALVVELTFKLRDVKHFNEVLMSISNRKDKEIAELKKQLADKEEEPETLHLPEIKATDIVSAPTFGLTD